jgi:hypothetical protein
MRAVVTEKTNHNFGPPPGQEEYIGNLPCEMRDVDLGDGLKMKFVYATYVPSDEERKAIAEGQNVELGVGWIGSFPPVRGFGHYGISTS